MNFICYGAHGWIGTQMTRALLARGHKITVGFARCENYEELCKELDSTKPSFVFCSVGRTHGKHTDGKVYTTIDFLELPGNLELNMRDNFVGPLNLARACKERGLKCAYLGTGCIFEYDSQHKRPANEEEEKEQIDCTALKGFNEDDVPNFFGSSYSIVKGWTDKQMHTYEDTVLNFRIRMPISREKGSRDFITKITTYQKVCSIANSMTVLEEIIPIMIHMMERGTTGTYNMCNPGLITHNQILELYKKHVNPDFTYENFTVEEQAKILKAGRSNNYLDTTKLESYCKKNKLILNDIVTACEINLKEMKSM